jgi:hypothetical protein
MISVRVDHDDRLVAAVGGAARYLADVAGLDNDVILQFQDSVVSACRFCFQCHNSAESCAITLRRSEDRIEVEVFLDGSEPLRQEKPSWKGIDEVHCEAGQSTSMLRLTKFVPTGHPGE